MKNGVKALRLKLGFVSQTAFAKALGNITVSAISNYEKEDQLDPKSRDPKLDIAWQMIFLAEKLGEKASLEDIYLRPSKRKYTNQTLRKP